MKERVCKHQRTIFETRMRVHISSCGNYRCIYNCEPVSKAICMACQLRAEPDAEDDHFLVTMGDVYDRAELEQRSEEEQALILDTYCHRCKHYDKGSTFCTACGCSSFTPIDEYVKYVAFTCPLELWG
ncbi:MAG: hypothetical protein ACYTBX_12605 [Planctomycetota bacterium]